uniref:SCP domain-containing protein n=1 Tax=Mesocestoides corti TaxID=53468 RepID=A0A5K3FR91_MESCO
MCNLIYLLVLSWCVLAKVPSREERITIVECHAKLREEVEPPASNMQLMSYSTKMEKLAQDLFLHCDSGYPEFDPKYQDVGIVELTSENETPRYRDLCKVNGTTYSYNEDRCTGDCLSYLRMVWAASTEVGCATGRCANKADPAERDDFIICTYKPSVLRFNARPYARGTSCTRCPTGYGCYRNQCRKDSLIIKHLQFPQCITKSAMHFL